MPVRLGLIGRMPNATYPAAEKSPLLVCRCVPLRPLCEKLSGRLVHLRHQVFYILFTVEIPNYTRSAQQLFTQFHHQRAVIELVYVFRRKILVERGRVREKIRQFSSARFNQCFVLHNALVRQKLAKPPVKPFKNMDLPLEDIGFKSEIMPQLSIELFTDGGMTALHV